MAVRRPTLDQLRSVAEDLGMHMGDEELKSYDALMQGNYAAYDIVDAMPDYVPAVTYPRAPGYRPEGDENRYNAWCVERQARGQEDRDKRQCQRGRRSHDERRFDA
jgi:amidase